MRKRIRLEFTKAGVGFTREQAEGAIPNLARVVKVATEPNDAHPIGAHATILGSMRHPDDGRLLYFVLWDDAPTTPVAVIAYKIAAAAAHEAKRN